MEPLTTGGVVKIREDLAGLIREHVADEEYNAAPQAVREGKPR